MLRALTRAGASPLRTNGARYIPPTRGSFFKSTVSVEEPSTTDSETATFDLPPFETHRISPPGTTTEATSSQLRDYHQQMYRMRRMEQEADSLYTRGLVRGFCHLNNGQEAVAVGIEDAITYEDCLITAYRNHCQQLARGDTVGRILAELAGRIEGCSKGKGGSMHLYMKENNYYGGNGIVGAQGPLGAGLGFAMKYYGGGNVCVTMFGDGAANQGQISEAINMAALWKLPVVFLCENNQYGMGTSIKRAAASGKFFTRGDYIPGIRIDGMDVLAVREGMRFAVKVAREQGPIYVEMDTYRYKGHSISDQGLSYRSVDEIKMIQGSRDAIDRVKARLIEHGWATPEELKAEEKKIRKEIDQAVKFAQNAEQPPIEDLYKDIYVNDKGMNIRGTLSTNGTVR